MNFGNPVVLASFGAVAVVVGTWVARHFFSADARLERRRRRSNTRVTSTAKRPTVRLSVRTKKDRRK